MRGRHEYSITQFQQQRPYALLISIALFIAGSASAQQISDYLITNNIGDFLASANPTSGKGPGIVVGADHFYHDHADMTYRISYFNLQTKVGPEIQVTQHSGSDSDKWLLHEVENNFRRNPEQDRFKGVLREINGNRVFTYARGTTTTGSATI